MWPPYTYVILGAVEGFFGNYGGCFYAAQAYVVDLVINKDELTFRLNIVSNIVTNYINCPRNVRY